MSIMGESFMHSSKSSVWRWHVDSCNLNNISWGAHSGNWTSSDHFNCPWNMTNWYLIRWLLNFDILVTHKFTLLDLQNEISLNHILDTLLRWAFNLWSKLPSIDALIHFKSASITCIDSNLHARLDNTASSDNTLD
jgi:hypothetical protein